MGEVLILGIGNILWADEGFGVRVVQALQESFEFPSEVTLLDGGTQGLGLIPHVQKAELLTIIDAVDFGLQPGSLVEMQGEEVPAYLGANKMSLHQTSFQEVLALCQLLGNLPKHLLLVGVQPEILEDYGGSLSPVVKAQIHPAMERVIAYLAAKGIDAAPKTSSPEGRTDASSMEEYERLRPSATDACRIGDGRFL